MGKRGDMELTTTFKRLRAAGACQSSYRKLRRTLKGTKDTAPINLLTILESNGLDDALWALRATTQNCDRTARLLAADFAAEVLPIWHKHYPRDNRPALAIQAARDFANGLITDDQMSAAESAARSAAESAAIATESAARSAAESAARSAAWSAARSAAIAAWSAAEGAWSAAGSAAWSAAIAAWSAADGAWSAAESAAITAAGSAAITAAGSAAVEKQTAIFIAALQPE